jgi:hydrogenase 3 maturation protease
LLNKLRLFLKDADVVAIIGMGSELRGDDAVGLLVVRLLKPFCNNRVQVFEGYMNPEVFIAPACAVHPTHLLIIDAAELHKHPGEWQVLSSDAVEQGLFTTHAIPALEVAAEIQRRCGAKVAFLGIQPKSRDISLSLSLECRQSAEDIAENIRNLMKIP